MKMERIWSFWKMKRKDAYDFKAKNLKEGYNDPFALLQKVVKEGHKLPSYDLSSMENNEIVVKILEAAKYAAKTGKTIEWKELYPDK